MSYAAPVEQHRAWLQANKPSCHTRRFTLLPYSRILYVFILFFQHVKIAYKNIQHSMLLSEMALGVCEYKLKMEKYMQIYLWQNTGYTNWVCRDRLAFAFAITHSEHSSYYFSGSQNPEFRTCQALQGIFR